MTELTGPMRRALELAWEAFRSGSFPVGAVIVDADGTVVAEGRNRIGERPGDAPPGRLAGVALAHAEMDALAQLPFGHDYTGHRLYTSLEPCVLCRSAATMTGIGEIHFLGVDPVCRGLDALAGLNPHLQRRHPRVIGPGDGAPAAFAGALPLAVLLLFTDRRDEFVAEHAAHEPALVAAAERIVRDDRWPPRELPLAGAVAALHDLLAP